jgi:predicted NBD/HSP70 family sugar kinase
MITLDPRGAYAIGVRLDRSRIETVLADLGGAILGHRSHDMVLPPPEQALRLLQDDVAAMLALVPADRRDRVTGLGLAQPYNLGSWLAELDLPREVFARWEDVGFPAALQDACGLTVFEENDGTAAAIAELFHGNGRALEDFLYLFIGPAIGAGIVLGGHSVRGSTGNAADIAVMPVGPSALPSASPRFGGRDLLIGRASLNALMRHLRWHGIKIEGPGALPGILPTATPLALEWLDDCADALVGPLMAARALLDVPVVVVDSDLDAGWIDRLIARAQPALNAAAAEARTAPTLIRGSLGGLAGALGAATLPLFFHFGPASGQPSGALPATQAPGGSYALVA